MMVGDHLDDLKCGKGAGCVSVLLKNNSNLQFIPEADLAIDSLEDLIPLLKEGFEISRQAS